MTTQYLSAAETAKLIRASLKEAFPGVKFGVRSSTYSGGASVYVRWVDGPNEAQVEAVAGNFKGSYFDSGIDYKGSVLHMIGGQPTRFGADFVFVAREYSDAAVARAIERFARMFAGNLRRDCIEKPTVAQWRSGALLRLQLSGVHHSFSRSVHTEIGEILAKTSDRLRVAKSKTAAAVFVAGDDGYGRACGSGAGAAGLVVEEC